MLTLIIPESNELFNEETDQFYKIPETKISLEHSLVSISKWESKWHKYYLDDKEKTSEEVLDYVRCMTITQNIDPIVYTALPSKVIQEIANYINDPMTATTITTLQKRPKDTGEKISSELIYYWMFKLGIPKDCEKWHLNRLLTLIQIYGAKEEPPKKMSKNEILRRNKALNAQRRAKLHSKG